MNIKRLSILSLMAAAAAVITAGAAQWDDDDDIYYNPSSQPSRPANTSGSNNRNASNSNSGSYYVPNTVVNYPGAETYTVPAGSGLNVDVDAYNRHGSFLVNDSTAVDTTAGAGDTFAYTRRLERYHNGDIVNASGDTQLIDYYYASEPQQDVNIYVVNVDPFFSPWYSTSYYWNNPWGWNRYWYDPYFSFSWGWGPSWNWGWSWGPSWNWGWSWGPSWGWGPGWDWSPGWDWEWAPRPPRPPYGGGHGWAVNAPGSSRPHAPAGSSSTVGRRPGAISVGANRPGNMGRPSGGYTPSRRPGNSGQAARPGYSAPSNSGSNSGYQSAGSLNRGRGNQNNGYTPSYNNGNSGSRRSSGYNNNNNNSGSRRSSGSYNSGSSSRGRSSSSWGGSSGGGSRSTHSSGGGSRGRR